VTEVTKVWSYVVLDHQLHAYFAENSDLYHFGILVPLWTALDSSLYPSVGRRSEMPNRKITPIMQL